MKVEIYQVAMELDNGLVLKNFDNEHKWYDITLKNKKKLLRKQIVDINETELWVVLRTAPSKIKLEDIENITKTDEV